MLVYKHNHSPFTKWKGVHAAVKVQDIKLGGTEYCSPKYISILSFSRATGSQALILFRPHYTIYGENCPKAVQVNRYEVELEDLIKKKGYCIRIKM